MKRRDLVKLLLNAGYREDGGTNHEHFVKDGKTITVPRHREILETTAKKILRQAGLR